MSKKMMDYNVADMISVGQINRGQMVDVEWTDKGYTIVKLAKEGNVVALMDDESFYISMPININKFHIRGKFLGSDTSIFQHYANDSKNQITKDGNDWKMNNKKIGRDDVRMVGVEHKKIYSIL